MIRFLLLLCATLSFHAAAIAAVPTTPPCGASVTTDLYLDSDMYCPGYEAALYVEASNVTIHLQKKTIRGDGRGTAIGYRGGSFDNVNIAGPGFIKDFQLGVSMQEFSNSGVRDVMFFDNHTAILAIDSADGEFSYNTITGPAGLSESGILLLDGSSGNTVRGNKLSQVHSDGIKLLGDKKRIGNIVEGNSIDGAAHGIMIGAGEHNIVAFNEVRNSNYGISLVESAGNFSLENAVISNTVFGATFSGISTNGASLNTIEGNLVELNTWGIEISGNLDESNRIIDNILLNSLSVFFYDNGTDTLYSGNTCQGAPCP